MGACMAPAGSGYFIQRHLEDFQITPEAYDRIITGDLGSVGQRVLIDLLRERDIDIAKQHMDCGMEIFDARTQDTHAGGSGCGCQCGDIVRLYPAEAKKRGVEKSPFPPHRSPAGLVETSFNEGKSVPGIAHGVVLESVAGN